MKLRITNYELRIIKSVLNLCLSLFICGLISSVFAQNDGSQQNQTGKAGTFAIVNARIVTVSGGVIENGTLIIRNGKIESVGANVSVPSGAERIDAKGLSVYPGMIDAGTNLGLTEIQAVAASVDVAETGEMNSNARAITGYQSALDICRAPAFEFISPVSATSTDAATA